MNTSKTSPSKPTAADLYQNLYRKYQLRMMSTAVVPEASIGFHNSRDKGFKELKSLESETSVRRIDALIMFRDKRWAVEIKVSKQDLKHELSQPEKQALWALHTDAFYFYVTSDLLEYALEHVPKQYGIMTDSRTVTKDWGYGPMTITESGVVVVRRAKKNLAPVDLPYATVRRMGAAYSRSFQSLREMKTSQP